MFRGVFWGYFSLKSPQDISIQEGKGRCLIKEQSMNGLSIYLYLVGHGLLVGPTQYVVVYRVADLLLCGDVLDFGFACGDDKNYPKTPMR